MARSYSTVDLVQLPTPDAASAHALTYPFTTSMIAARYNVCDPDYAAKIDYVIGLFAQLKR